jgi:hypothetical protein
VQFLQALHSRFLYFTLISYISPQKLSSIHPIYHRILALLATPPVDEATEFAAVVAALKALAEARKVRNVSFLRNLLVHVPAEFPALQRLARHHLLEAGLTVDEANVLQRLLSPQATAPHAPVQACVEPGAEQRLADARTIVLQRVGTGLAVATLQAAVSLYEHVLVGRWAAVPAALQFLTQHAAAAGRRRAQVARLFWALFGTVAQGARPDEVRPYAVQVLTTLQTAYGQTREADIYAITALELLLAYGVAEWQDAAARWLFVPPTAPEVDDMLQECRSGARLELDRYVLDKHTRAGRKAGMSGLQFALEGAVVVPERTTLELPLAKPLYMAVKLFQDVQQGALGWSEATAGVQAAGSLSVPEQRQVLALLRLLKRSISDQAHRSADGGVSPEASRRARACPHDTALAEAARAYTVAAELRGTEFAVLGTMVGCQGGTKPLLRQVRMLADGHMWLLKPVKDGFYAFVDGQKERYGLARIGMDVVQVDGALHVRMRFVEGAENLSRLPQDLKQRWYMRQDLRRQFLRIVMFRIGMHVSDTNTYNTLVIRPPDGPWTLLSIDEMTVSSSHGGPNVFGGAKVEALMRTADSAWAQALLQEWEEQGGGPLDYAYLKQVWQERLGWVF